MPRELTAAYLRHSEREQVPPPLPTIAGGYQIIAADPPWQFQTWSARGGGRSALRYYPTMSTDAICSLPVAKIAASQSVLFLWTIFTRLPDALDVMACWGFVYKTVAFTWVKTNKDGSPFMGLGYYTRQNAEVCLLGVRGASRLSASSLQRVAADVSSVVLSPRREHSRKPNEVYQRIERLFGPAKRLEMFAREARPGWTPWGLGAPTGDEVAAG
jgi:N6-adenosine-specific RNA methylase IME4